MGFGEVIVAFSILLLVWDVVVVGTMAESVADVDGTHDAAVGNTHVVTLLMFVWLVVTKQ